MDTEEFRTAQLCCLYLEEFFNHSDNFLCIVCKMKCYYHKRSSSCNSSTVLVNNSTPTPAEHNNLSMSPPMNQKMGMAGGLSSSKSIFDSSTSIVINSVDAGTVPIINNPALDSLFYDFSIPANPFFMSNHNNLCQDLMKISMPIWILMKILILYAVICRLRLAILIVTWPKRCILRLLVIMY
jgi:hypothetical protein